MNELAIVCTTLPVGPAVKTTGLRRTSGSCHLPISAQDIRGSVPGMNTCLAFKIPQFSHHYSAFPAPFSRVSCIAMSSVVGPYHPSNEEEVLPELPGSIADPAEDHPSAHEVIPVCRNTGLQVDQLTCRYRRPGRYLPWSLGVRCLDMGSTPARNSFKERCRCA